MCSKRPRRRRLEFMNKQHANGKFERSVDVGDRHLGVELKAVDFVQPRESGSHCEANHTL